MKYLKSLFIIALPIILQNFLSSFVNMLDTVMVGQLGTEDIAAVGLANQIFFVLTIVTFGIISGASIFISQYWGKRDIDGIHKTMGIAFAGSGIAAVLFFLAAILFPKICLGIYTQDPVVIEKGAVYLRFVSPSYLIMGLSFAISQACRSTEHVKLPMYATGISVIINGALNYILIFGVTFGDITMIPALGITGAAIATVFARVVELFLLLIIPIIRKYEIVASLSKYFSFKSEFFLRYIKIAIPVLLNESLWGIGTSLQNSIYGHSGTDVLAAFNITSTISNLVWTFFIGCGNAAAILIGKRIGEQKYDEAKSLAKKLTAFMMESAGVLALVLIPLAFCLKYFFNVESDVIHMAQVFLFITVVMYPLYACNMITVVGVCRSGGDTIYAMIMDVGFMWLISIPLGYCAVLFWHWPYWVVFLCLQIESVCKTIMGIPRMRNGKWLHDVTVE